MATGYFLCQITGQLSADKTRNERYRRKKHKKTGGTAPPHRVQSTLPPLQSWRELRPLSGREQN